MALSAESTEVQEASKQEVLHNGHLGQHLHLIHLQHATVDLQAIKPTQSPKRATKMTRATRVEDEKGRAAARAGF